MLHLVFVRTSQVEVGYLVETYEVYSAKQPSEQPYYAFGVSDGVVDAFEDNVFERQPPLVCEVVPVQQCYHLFYVVGVLHRHHLCTFVGKRIVQRYSQMALCVVEKCLDTFP